MKYIKKHKIMLYLNFIDFGKAFGSIDWESYWKSLASYGVPQKIINSVKAFYSDFRCIVINKVAYSD